MSEPGPMDWADKMADELHECRREVARLKKARRAERARVEKVAKEMEEAAVDEEGWISHPGRAAGGSDPYEVLAAWATRLKEGRTK